jgi:hypothetical protein
VRRATQRDIHVRNVLTCLPHRSKCHVIVVEAPHGRWQPVCSRESGCSSKLLVEQDLPYLSPSVIYVILRRNERRWPPEDHKHLQLCTHTGASLRVKYDVYNIRRTYASRATVEKATHNVWTGVPCARPRNPELRRPNGLSSKSARHAS